MTSLDPTHIPLHPFRGKASEGQALHHPSSSSKSSGSFPDELPADSSDDEISVDGERHAERRARREGRKRVQAAMLPIPDQRLEQVRVRSVTQMAKLYH